MNRVACVLGLISVLCLSSCQGILMSPVSSQNFTVIQQTSVLTSINGSVKVLKGEAWISGEEATLLNVNDILQTGADSRAVVTFFDGSTLELAANTEIRILELSQQGNRTTVSLSQQAGQTVSQVARFLDPASRYDVATPAAVAAVRGSAMVVTVDSDGTTTVGNIEGHVVVTAQGAELAVPEGQNARVRPSQPLKTSQPTLTKSPGTSQASTTTMSFIVGNLKAEVTIQKTVRLTWDSYGGAASFRIERSRSSHFTFIDEVFSVPPDRLAFTDDNIVPGVRYYYRVWALASGGPVTEVSSNTVAITIPTYTSTPTTNQPSGSGGPEPSHPTSLPTTFSTSLPF